MSYDERGRVEALLRYTENIGFDAVYYTWNSMNQVVSVRSADMMRQHTSWYGFDAQGRIDTVWTRLSATGLGLKAVSGILYPAPQARPDTADIVYRYTKTGMLDTMLYPPVNVVVSYDYNHRKWLDSLVAMKSGIKLFREILSYDPAGQITQQVWQQGTNAKRKQIYRYDSVQRLTRWTNGPQTGGTTDSTTYAYDNVGNRQSVAATAAPAETYTYTTGTSQLGTHRQTPTLGNIVERYYTYNGNGSVIAREKYEQISGGWVWKGREEIGTSYRELAKRYRLVTPGAGGGGPVITDWHYRYGAGGEREQKRQYPAVWGDTDMVYAWQYYLLGANREQLAVYHGQQVLNLYCHDSVRRVWMYPWEYLTYGVGDPVRVITRPWGKKEYVVADHLGSQRSTVETGGTVIATNDYAPFGERLAVTGGTPRKGYIDKENDRESGLENTGIRQVDGPRFLSVDALWEKFPGTSPYVYSMNNPIRLFDANGAVPYRFVVRAFVPTPTFAWGWGGDDRGFSASFYASSRLHHYAALETDDGSIMTWGFQGVSKHPVLGSEQGEPTLSATTIAPVNEDRNGSRTFHFMLKTAGSDPLVPGAPDVDLNTEIVITENKKRHKLSLTALIRGDKFPDAEALIQDPSGQTVFIGTFAWESGSSPYWSLFGEGEDQMIRANFMINTDNAGNFTSVAMNGQTYSINAWNQQFLNRNANP